MTMTDATLRERLKNQHLRAQLRRLVAEETADAGGFAVGMPAVAAPPGASTRGRNAGAAVTPTEAASEGLVPPEDGLPEPPRIENSVAVREEYLTDYEGETHP